MDSPLRTLVLLRGAFNLLFAIYLLIQPMFSPGAGQNGYYALGDGAIGLVLAVVLFRNPQWRWLFILVLLDGLVRLALGAFLFANPGIMTGAVGSIFVYTAVIFMMSALGLAGMVIGMVGQPVPTGAAGGRRARAWAVFFAGLWTLLFGVALLVGPSGADGSRLIICVYTFAFGLTLLCTGTRLVTPKS